MVEQNRRKLLKAVGTSTIAGSGLGITSTGSVSAEGDEPTLVELNGNKKNQLRTKALQSSEFKSLKQYALQTYDVTPKVDETNAYKAEYGDEIRYGVEVPLSGINNSVHSAIAVFIQDGEITGATGSTAKVDSERVVEYTQFKVGTDGTVTAENIPLATREDRQTIFQDYGPSGIRIAGQCSDCEWAIKRLCGWGCGITAALFCGLIGVAYPIAGIGCGALFTLYCYELGASGSCYYRGSAKADCEFMGYC